MAHDAGEYYDAVDDGHGGCRLIPKGPLAKAMGRYRVRDDLGTRNFLPGKEVGYLDSEEETDPHATKVVARLADPGEQRHYSLAPDGDGSSWIVTLVSGPDPNLHNGEQTTGDRSRIHKLHFPDGDPSLRAMNIRNRRHWSRDTGTRDKENQVFRTGPILEGERLELRGPDKFGMYDLVLVSADQPDISPRRANGIGDRGLTEAERLRNQNAANKSAWTLRRNWT